MGFDMTMYDPKELIGYSLRYLSGYPDEGAWRNGYFEIRQDGILFWPFFGGFKTKKFFNFPYVSIVDIQLGNFEKPSIRNNIDPKHEAFNWKQRALAIIYQNESERFTVIFQEKPEEEKKRIQRIYQIMIFERYRYLKSNGYLPPPLF